MSAKDAGDRHLVAQIAAHESWANTEDRTSRTAPARAALSKKFLKLAGGNPLCAEHLRRAHFAGLALRSAQARRKARDPQSEAPVKPSGGGNGA